MLSWARAARSGPIFLPVGLPGARIVAMDPAAVSDYAAHLAALLSRHGFQRHVLTRNRVGHFQLVGSLAGEAVDILLDTGAASTVVDLGYCRRRGLALRDTGRLGGGAGGVTLPIHDLGDVGLTLDGLAVHPDGVFAIDLSHVIEGLAEKGAEPVQAVLGVDVLLHHDAVIDYATRSLFLRHGER